MATENDLVNHFCKVKQIERRVSKKMLSNVLKILNTTKTNDQKIELIFNEFFEMYHLKKVALSKPKKIKN